MKMRKYFDIKSVQTKRQSFSGGETCTTYHAFNNETNLFQMFFIRAALDNLFWTRLRDLSWAFPSTTAFLPPSVMSSTGCRSEHVSSSKSLSSFGTVLDRSLLSVEFFLWLAESTFRIHLHSLLSNAHKICWVRQTPQIILWWAGVEKNAPITFMVATRARQLGKLTAFPIPSTSFLYRTLLQCRSYHF